MRRLNEALQNYARTHSKWSHLRFFLLSVSFDAKERELLMRIWTVKLNAASLWTSFDHKHLEIAYFFATLSIFCLFLYSTQEIVCIYSITTKEYNVKYWTDTHTHIHSHFMLELTQIFTLHKAITSSCLLCDALHINASLESKLLALTLNSLRFWCAIINIKVSIVLRAKNKQARCDMSDVFLYSFGQSQYLWVSNKH